MEAKARGLSCALIEKGPLGGTCLNTGCIPTKSLIQSAKVLTQAKNRPSLALWLRLPVLIFKGPGTQTGHCFGAWQRDRVHINGTDIIRAEARLIGPDCVRAGNTDYRARWIIVAVSSLWSIDLSTINPVSAGVNNIPIIILRRFKPSRNYRAEPFKLSHVVPKDSFEAFIRMLVNLSNLPGLKGEFQINCSEG